MDLIDSYSNLEMLRLELLHLLYIFHVSSGLCRQELSSDALV
ncbi:hypothetical protein EVA_07859 [gut metagenome]|uniref:Uncharacterized protein n=1 Tax=gut metagenome TaxID=749906 RepID=J9GUE7_9ZZZZ